MSVNSKIPISGLLLCLFISSSASQINYKLILKELPLITAILTRLILQLLARERNAFKCTATAQRR
jgi:hypothetical protein